MEYSEQVESRVAITKANLHENTDLAQQMITIPSHLVEAEHRLVLRENYRNLKETLENCIDFDPKRCTWNDVIDQLNRAREESDTRQRKWHRKARQVVANVGDDAGPWLKMIPSENGLSVLNGGLAYIFQAARCAEQNKETILTAFGDIPAAVQKAADKLTAFPSETRLRDCAMNLQQTILQELPILIELLLHKQLKHRLLAPLRTQNTSNRIEKCLDLIKRRVIELEDLTTSLTQLTTVRTFQSVTAIHGKQDKSIELQRYLVSKQEQDKQEIIAAIAEKGAVNPRDALLQVITDHPEEFQAILRDRAQEALKQTEEERRRLHIHSFLSLEDLREILSVDPLKAVNDLHYVLKQDINFNTISKGQARYLLQREEFNRWFSCLDPDILIVDGNLTTSRSSRISPLSLVCANLVDSLIDIGHAVPLHFFCSENMPLEEDSSGPETLMRGLLEQLLATLDSRGCLSLDFIDSRRWQRGLEDLDLAVACQSFWKLVNQLPPISVYCIIDGMSLYEREEWKEDLLFLIEELREMVQDDKLRPRLKILVTNPTRARYIGRVVEREKHISLNASDIDMRPLSDRITTLREQAMIPRGTLDIFN